MGWAASKVHEFEVSAAATIKSKLTGEHALVKVEAQPNIAWGSVAKATIMAENFSLDALPLYTEPKRAKSGQLDHLILDLTNFRLRGLRIAQLKADIPNSKFDLGLALGKKELRLSRSGVGLGSVKVEEKDLADFIVRKFGEIKRCTVRVYNDIVWVDGYGEFLIVKSNFTVIAHLKPVDGTKLVLTDAKIYFDWVRADEFAAKTLLKTLNPVVDLKKDLGLLDAVEVETVTCRNGVVIASGKTKIPELPAENTR